jgi:hypothetical protein
MTKHCGFASAMQDPASLFMAPISWDGFLACGRRVAVSEGLLATCLCRILDTDFREFLF